MHKPHKVTGGDHEKAQAQAIAWVQPMANTVTPHVHVPQQHQQQLWNSDIMDVDIGGRHPALKWYSCGKLGHVAKFCRNKWQIRGGSVGVKRGKDFVKESNEFPYWRLQTNLMYYLWRHRTTVAQSPNQILFMWSMYYIFKFTSKLWHAALWSPKSTNQHASKGQLNLSVQWKLKRKLCEGWIEDSGQSWGREGQCVTW